MILYKIYSKKHEIMDGKSELFNLIVQTQKYHSRDGYEISQAPKKLQFPKTAHPKKWNLAKCRCSL